MSIKSLFAYTCCRLCGRRHGNYLTLTYLVCKVIFIANVVLQLFALNVFLGQQFSIYGFDVLGAMMAGHDWTQSERFPRVTMCDFMVRRLGNVHRYTVQCVLPINLFNEKIYLFVWFWMVMVAAVTCFSLVRWTLRAMFVRDRRLFVKKHLLLSGKYDDEIKKDFARFVDEYLQQDGVFVLRLLGHNTNTATLAEFVSSLWDSYHVKKSTDIESKEDDL